MASPLRRVWIPSPNYSGRGGARVRLVVIHTAEGARTYQSLGSFFSNPSSGVSSHTGIDDTPGTIGEYVDCGQKAWTAASFNPVAVQTELCAFAAWDSAEWSRHPAMLENCGRWISEECKRFGIPIRKLTPAEAQGGALGVCGHGDLGSAGGNHWDPGNSFPWSRVLDMALSGVPAGTEDQEEMDARIATNPNNQGKVLLDLSSLEYRGISSIDIVNYLKAQGVKEATGITPEQWRKFKQVGTI